MFLSQAGVDRCSVKELFRKILQNLHQNESVGCLFNVVANLQQLRQRILWKTRVTASVFSLSCVFLKISIRLLTHKVCLFNLGVSLFPLLSFHYFPKKQYHYLKTWTSQFFQNLMLIQRSPVCHHRPVISLRPRDCHAAFQYYYSIK